MSHFDPPRPSRLTDVRNPFTASESPTVSDTRHRGLRRVVGLLAFLMTCGAMVAASARPARADEWNQYRGPHHDGTSAETGIAEAWKAQPPRQLWTVHIGEGFGTFAVSGKRAYVLVARKNQETCLALDTDTGKEQWATPIDKTINDREGGSNPRTTPTIDGDHVFLVSTFMKFACLDAADGKVLWQHDLGKEMDAQQIHWGNAGSPILDGDKIFIGGGGPGKTMMAFDKNTGKLLWATGSEKLTQASPVPCTIHGTRQVIFFMQSGLVSASTDGKELWRWPFPFGVATAVSPVVGGKDGDIVYVTNGYGIGGGACRVMKDGDKWSATEAWRTKGGSAEKNATTWSTPVYDEGHLYGLFGQKQFRTGPLRCVEMDSGKEVWSKPGFGSGGGVILVDKHVLVQGDEGIIALVEATPQGYKEVGRLPSIGHKCWSAAILADGRIYARNETEGFCFEIKGK